MGIFKTPKLPAPPPPPPLAPSLASSINYFKRPAIGPASGQGLLGGTFMTGAQGNPSRGQKGVKTLLGQ